jgi:hypothetical protein
MKPIACLVPLWFSIRRDPVTARGTAPCTETTFELERN